jgi:hypothetical protein
LAALPTSVVLSDLHLCLERRPRVSAALCEVIAAYPQTEFIFGGDSFEFSSIDEPDPAQAWRRLCDANPKVMDALRSHIEGGGSTTFLAGNHDAALPVIAPLVQQALAPNRPAAVAVAPWFVRRGSVHIEHGHLWDRDNAPLHPLADWSTATEPLGISLMRRFVTGQGAAIFAHAHDTTPVAGLWRAFRLFGHRFPWMAVRYFSTAASLCFEAGLPRKLQIAEAARTGQGRLSSVAAVAGVCPAALERVLRGAPAPTHASAADTFMRLYFDRVFASVGLTLGAGAVAVAGAAPLTLGVLGASVAYLAAASLRPRPRYVGPVEALRAASEVVADALSASLVVFGHSHVPEQSERYVNLGSFTYCRQGGRPYATLDSDGQVTLRRHAEIEAGD